MSSSEFGMCLDRRETFPFTGYPSSSKGNDVSYGTVQDFHLTNIDLNNVDFADILQIELLSSISQSNEDTNLQSSSSQELFNEECGDRSTLDSLLQLFGENAVVTDIENNRLEEKSNKLMKQLQCQKYQRKVEYLTLA